MIPLPYILQRTSPRPFYLTSTCRCFQSSFKLSSTSLSSSLARITAISIIPTISSGLKGTPPAFWTTHNSRCAFRATESNPALSLCSRCEGSSIGCVCESGKYANVKQKGVWCIESGTGARSDGWCCNVKVLNFPRIFKECIRAYNCDFFSNNFNFWSSEMFKCYNTGETRAIEKIARICEAMDSEAKMPHLKTSSSNGEHRKITHCLLFVPRAHKVIPCPQRRSFVGLYPAF